MLPQEIIRKKRDGKRLAAGEIGEFIAGVTSGRVTEGQVAALAMATFFNGMSRDEAVALTLAMRDSGDVLDWSDLPGSEREVRQAAALLRSCGGRASFTLTCPRSITGVRRAM